MVWLVIETGRRKDTLGRLSSTQGYEDVRAARDRLAAYRVEWQANGFEQDADNETVYWRKDIWLQGLVVDDRGERV